jgi:ATP-dependent Clp protease ATP-binding subunit ClpB
MEALRSRFKPEFLNRIDDTVIFNSLGKTQLAKIIDLETEKLQQRLSDRKLSLHITKEAKETLAFMGYDPAYGARPLKRVLQREVATPIAQAILSGQFLDGDTVEVAVRSGKVAVVKSGKAGKQDISHLKPGANVDDEDLAINKL